MNRSRTRALFAVAILGLAGMGFSRANAQEPPPLPPILEPGEAEELASNVVAQVMSAAADALAPPQTNPMTPANAGLARQPEPTPIDPDRSGDRRSSRRSGRDYSNQSRSSRGDEARGGIASAGSTPAPGNSQPSDTRPDFSNFRIIAERNIFDPNRRGYRAPTAREKPKTVESISLVGVMSYEKGGGQTPPARSTALAMTL